MTSLDLAALAAALTLSTVLLVVVVAAVWWFDRYDREPILLVIGVFLWGAFAAPVLAVAGFSVIGSALDIGQTGLIVVVGPLIEEVAKAVGVVLVVVLSREFDNPTDGLVYGTAAGLGFAATENLVYAVAGAGRPAIEGTITLVLARTVLAAGVHAVASATFGGFLGFALLSRQRVERAMWASVGLAVAVSIHAGWNFMLLRLDATAGPASTVRWFIVIPGLYALYLAALYLFLRSEQKVLRNELAEEVELDVLPKWVLEIIPSYRRRIRSEWWPSRRERTVLARLLTRLAFRKHAVKRLPVDESRLAGLEVVRLRQRIRTMLGDDRQCQISVEDDLPGP